MKPTTEPSPELIRACAVTAELLGTSMSEIAAEVFAQDLARYPLQQVLGALARCRREVKGRLVLADVLNRLDDGRPGPEEAWAMIPQDDGRSSVWTEEMQRAYGVACKLLAEDDAVGARMAFKEAYQREVQKARDEGVPVRWTATLGQDKGGRDQAKHDAAQRNRLAQGLPALPFQAPEHALAAPEGPRLRLASPVTVGDAVVGALANIPQARRAIAELRAKLKGDAA